MDVKEYRETLHEDMSIAAQADISTEASEFLDYATKVLIDAEEFDDFIECYYDGISKRRANMHIDGYSYDETDGSCCVFIVDYRGAHADDSIRNDDINTLFKKIRYFIEESIKFDLFKCFVTLIFD